MGGLHADSGDRDNYEARKFLSLCRHFGLDPSKQQAINAKSGHREAARIWARIRWLGDDEGAKSGNLPHTDVDERGRV